MDEKVQRREDEAMKILGPCFEEPFPSLVVGVTLNGRCVRVFLSKSWIEPEKGLVVFWSIVFEGLQHIVLYRLGRFGEE